MIPAAPQLAVVDWNFIQTNAYRTDIPPRYECLISDTVGLEVVGKKDRREFNDACARYAHWIKKNVDRIWIARPIGQVIDQQVTSLIRREGRSIPTVKQENLIDARRTNRFRTAARDPLFDWNRYLSDADTQPQVQYELGRSEFRSVAHQIALQPRAIASLLSMRGDREVAAEVRKLDLSNALASEYPSRIQLRIAQLIAKHRLKFIQMRCARIKLFYSARAARSQFFGDENDWDDLQYAVLSSYTGHLATFDTGLKNCVRHLFSRIRFVGVDA